jgi:hypothetical protein
MRASVSVFVFNTQALTSPVVFNTLIETPLEAAGQAHTLFVCLVVKRCIKDENAS